MGSGAVLALCASRCAGPWPFSIAVRNGDRGLLSLPEPGSRADLPAAAFDLCRGAGVGPGEIVEVRVDIGPGSYVGLRVAVTLARFLQRETGARLLAATSLELMACAAARHHALGGEHVHVLLDARRGRWHAAHLRVTGDSVCTVDAPHALPPAHVLTSLTENSVVVADPAMHEALATTARERNLRVLAPEPVDAWMLFDMRLALLHREPAELEPLYLMGTYADEPMG